MSTMQIRNVPDEVSRVTKARAALSGQSLSDYLLGLVVDAAQRPTVDEVRARLKTMEPVAVDVRAAEIIREHRDT